MWQRNTVLLGVLLLLFTGGVCYRSVQKDKLNARLMDAVSREDVGTVSRLLDRGADPNARNEAGAPCSTSDIVACARRLLAREHDRAPTALVWAVQSGNADIIALLLAHGADPNARGEVYDVADYVIDSPLILAVRDCHPKIVTELLAYGADPNMRDSAGRTPLALARAILSDLRKLDPRTASSGPEVRVTDLHRDTLLLLWARIGMYTRKYGSGTANCDALVRAFRTAYPGIIRALLARGAHDR